MRGAISMVKEGDVLAGKYRVERVIGQGGMGVVVSARHTQLGQQVALKFLNPSASENPEASARFLREAQAAVRIRSEHVARIIDVGTLETGAPYMVMEFLSGSDLGQCLETRGPLPIDEAIAYVFQACEALAEAHVCGIVHRDLKPSNLFLTRRADGSSIIKVLDFGISKTSGASLTGASIASVTATAAVMGSPAYMSPEQIRSSKHVDARTDVWALGVVIYQLISNRLPFEGETMTEIMAKVVADPPRPLRDVKPNVPAALEKVVLGCLEKDVGKRVANVGELARALAPFSPIAAAVSVERVARVLGQNAELGTATLLAPEAVPEATWMAPEWAGMPAPLPRDSTGSAWGTTGAAGPGRRRRLGFVAGGAAIVGMLAVGAFLGLRGASSSPESSAAPIGHASSGVATAPIAPPSTSGANASPAPFDPLAPTLAPASVDAGGVEPRHAWPSPVPKAAAAAATVSPGPRKVDPTRPLRPSEKPAATDDLFDDTK